MVSKKSWTHTFGDDVIDEAHWESEQDEVAAVVDETIEALHDVDFLALVTLVERDLLGVGDQAGVHVTELALVSLLYNGHARHWLAHQREANARHAQVGEHNEGTSGANRLGQLHCINRHVEDRLRKKWENL